MADTTQASSARITIDDVRTVLDGIDPNTTNAGKVRNILGRGSFETIQKHLNTLRAEKAAAAMPPVAADAIPTLPTEAAQAMWVAAWTAAQVQVMARSEKLAAERDAALSKLETMGQDVAGYVATVDDQAEMIEKITNEKETIESKCKAAMDALDARLSEQLHSNSVLAAALDKEKVQAAHAAELSENKIDFMRQENARLTDQISELKAALYKRVEASQEPATK